MRTAVNPRMALNRPPLSLKGRALRLLGAREHSRAELERKGQTTTDMLTAW